MGQRDPTDLRARERENAEEAERQRLARQMEQDNFKWLMQSKRGRAILWSLMDRAGVFQLSFNANSMQMAFNEGRRSYGNQILTLIHEVAPELYPTMVKEATNGRRDSDERADHSN